MTMGLIRRSREMPQKLERTYLDYEKLLTHEERELLEQIKIRKRRS